MTAKGKDLNRLAVDAGYFGYEAYLRSDHWRRFREDILRTSPKCRICGSTSAVVHHVDYARLGQELASDVVALCSDCHERIHVIHREKSLPLCRFAEAAKHVRRDRKRRPRREPSMPRMTAPEAPKPAIATTELTLFAHRDQVKRLVLGGYAIGWISRRYGWERKDVRAVIAWFKSQTR